MAQKAMFRVNKTDPVPAGAGMPLYKPKDTTIVKLEDKRHINPATGQPFKIKGTKSIGANEEDIKSIIAHAKAKGVDPSTALAIGLQETELGRLDPNYGSVRATFPDTGITPDTRDEYANILAKTLKDKIAYAGFLRNKGIIPHGEEYDLQAYNGLGILKPQMSVNGKLQNEMYYGIPVTESRPLDLRRNPAYGKTIKQLRDEVIRTNPRINELINSTPAYGVASAPSAEKPQPIAVFRKTK